MTRTPRRDRYADLRAASAAALLVLVAVLVGRHIQDTRHTLFVRWPPLFAEWDPHVGPGTPAAVLVAAGVVAYGPTLAVRLPWRGRLRGAWGAAPALSLIQLFAPTGPHQKSHGVLRFAKNTYRHMWQMP